MVDTRIEKLANLCVRYSADVKPEENVVIQGMCTSSLPLLHEIYKECLLLDAYPIVVIEPDGFEYTFYKYAKEHQLRHSSPVEKFMCENMNVHIRVRCKSNLKELTNIEPSRITRHIASPEVLAYSRTFMKRAAEGKLKWVTLLYPTNAQAQEAAMALSEYEDFVYSGCLVDMESPIEEWKKIDKKQEKVCKFLNKVNEIRIVGEDTDLTFGVKGRKWLNLSGKHNMPDGEVASAPLENSTNGTIRFTFPGIVVGREVEDIKLVFEKGQVLKAEAVKGNDLLQEMLKVEGADRIGEAAFGTNYGITRFTKNMLFDEKIGGTIHIALGDSYPETGGLNKSAVHWDILKDMKQEGEIYADGRLIYKNGRFLI